MKQWIHKILLLLLVCGLASSSFANNRKDFKKTIKKEFDLSKSGELDIDNKFGKVEIKTWDKNRVSIEVTVIVRADSEKEAEEVFDRISIHFSDGKDYVKAETEIKSKKSSSWFGWGGSYNSNDYAINYDVYMPASADLDLSNHHGESIIAKLKGDASIDIAHGEISAEGFEGNVELDIAHSEGTVGDIHKLTADIQHSDIRFDNIKEADFDMSHGDIEIEDVDILRLDSRHANFELGDVGELRADTRHDDFEIEYVGTIISEAQHTSFDIEKLGKLVDLDCSHGGATIDHIEANFQSVNLYGSHTNFRIRVDEDASYQLDAAGNHTGITYPSDMDVRYEKDKNSDREVKGFVGNANTKGARIIKARLSHGSLRVRQ